MTWIQSRGGRAVSLLSPAPEQIDLEDIAFALSHLYRFTGHAGQYSVAEHSVHVSHHVPPALARAALLHDAAEAYAQDLSTPMKLAMRELEEGRDLAYDEISRRIEVAICRRFQVPFEALHAAEVKEADLRMLETERRWFFPEPAKDWALNVEPLEATRLPEQDWDAERGATRAYPQIARAAFLTRAAELWIK